MSLINFRDTGIQLAVITVVLMVVAAVVGKALDFFHFREFAIAGAFVLTVLLISGGVTIYFLRQQLREWTQFSEEIKGAMANLDKRFDIVAVTAKADWLVPNERLMEIEKRVKCDTVWIITASLEEEISATLFAPIIKNNLKKGIKYRYLVPDDPVLRGRANNLKAALGDHHDLSFEFINDPLFKVISMQDFAIYLSERDSQAYMNLPIREGGTAYFLELGRNQTEMLVGHLRYYLEQRHLATSSRHS
jgi:hypothetical protein